jgi:hypothetical protein
MSSAENYHTMTRYKVRNFVANRGLKGNRILSWLDILGTRLCFLYSNNLTRHSELRTTIHEIGRSVHMSTRGLLAAPLMRRVGGKVIDYGLTFSAGTCGHVHNTLSHLVSYQMGFVGSTDVGVKVWRRATRLHLAPSLGIFRTLNAYLLFSYAEWFWGYYSIFEVLVIVI